MYKREGLQRGFVSILTVLLFTVLTSVVAVSFMRVVYQSQRESINADLSNGAYDAAQAGIAGAKRAIEVCKANPSNPACTGLLNTSCPGFISAFQTELALTTPPSGSNGVQVGDESANQRYTCVTISDEISTYIATLDVSSADKRTTFLPLRASAPFDRVKVSWFKSTQPSGTAFPASATVATDNRPVPNWTWPSAAVRMKIIDTPIGSFNGSQVDSRSSFIFPQSSGAATLSNYTSLSSRNTSGCSASPDPDGFRCSVTVTGLNPGAQSYYLQLSPLYANTDVKVELYNGANKVRMKEAGYTIDSTGVVADTYRRVQATLVPDNVVSPTSAVQAGSGGICKDFYVSGGTTPMADLCPTP